MTSPAGSPTRTHLSQIANTIVSLCKVCIEHKGHLPMSIPELPSTSNRTSPLVQICHGTPGLLYLLSLARKNTEFVKRYWTPEHDEAIKLCSERVWGEGLLSKGGGLCHGLAGNAWPWLVLHDPSNSGIYVHPSFSKPSPLTKPNQTRFQPLPLPLPLLFPNLPPRSHPNPPFYFHLSFQSKPTPRREKIPHARQAI